MASSFACFVTEFHALIIQKSGAIMFQFSSLQEPCLISTVRIYNKSVLEWEIAVGLRYKVRCLN
jgi:hypothetical protein